ncbi:transglutaminase family protein [Comamonas composti]|uniref:transglutaminase family protein n=1 Tax=Comamonas composti TaxID=408558 RepID=UPI00042A7C3D|nr:DUF3488 and transglutaminase-like domain-containing protein [Comamonas composti]
MSSPFPSTERLALLPRDARDTLFLLAVIAWILMPQASQQPWWSTLLTASLLLWRALLAWHGKPLPGRWVLGALLALAVTATWLTHRSLVGRDAGVTLMVALLALKTLELRARRDAMVVFFLGFFALLSNFFYSQSLLMALAMVLGLLGLLTALVNAHMTAGRPPLSQALRTATQLTLWGTPVMVVLFVLFPRMAPLWGVPADDLAGRTGLSQSMQVGSIASLAMDESVAMRLLFLTPEGAPPPSSSLYFRGPVLSLFDGREWRAEPQALLTRARIEPLGDPIRYQMSMEPSKRPWLPLLDATSEAPELPESRGRAHVTQQLQWQASRPITDLLRIEVQSHVDFRYGPQSFSPELRRYLELPSGSNPRTRELARQMQAEPELAQASPQAWVDAALTRLRSGDYAYTLEPGVVDSEHTADDFWFDSKQGFCEHIASAFAVLMRSLGVPARIVTGYQGGERNYVDGYWTVRNSDAHAWAEVWLENRGWVRVDPTGAVSPARVGQLQRLAVPRGALAGAVGNFVPRGTLEKLRTYWEAVNNHWNQWVLNYTQSRQLDLLASLGLESPSWLDMLRMLGLLAALSALGWLGWLAKTREKRDAWTRLMDQARKRLAQSGMALGPSLAPRALAALFEAHYRDRSHDSAPDPQNAVLVQAIVDWLLRMERLRYAPSSQPEDLARLRREWRALRWPVRLPPQTDPPIASTT